MKKLALFALLSLVTSFNASALDALETLYAERLVHGGASTVRNVASSMQAVKDLDSGLYDIAAEVLLRDYKAAQDKTTVDSLSWITKALVASQDSRYLDVLAEVRDNAANKKLRKYAKKTHRKLKKQQRVKNGTYTAGTVDLASIKQGSSHKGRGKHELSVLKVGMNAGDVYDLVGQPTSESGSITGQAFNPFNYSGKGTVRTTAYYKGKGSVVFENTSSYTSGRRVRDVVLDEYESGYR